VAGVAPDIYIYGVATTSRLLKIVGLFFAKEPHKRDDILQKRPIILRSLLTAATPYMCIRKEWLEPLLLTLLLHHPPNSSPCAPLYNLEWLEWLQTYTYTGWLQIVGSLKL